MHESRFEFCCLPRKNGVWSTPSIIRSRGGSHPTNFSKVVNMHIAVSLERIGISYASAAALGILLGLLMGRSQLIRDIVSPYIEVLRPIPAVA